MALGDISFTEVMPHSVVFSKTVEGLYQRRRRSYPGIEESSTYKQQNRFSFLDWQLVPTERFSIPGGEIKEAYVTIPGTNGSLDLTEAMGGYPLYEDIEGSMEFMVLHDQRNTIYFSYPELGEQNVDAYKELSKEEQLWTQRYFDMKQFLHGKKLYMMLEDNPTFYYYGRFSVGEYDTEDGKFSKVTIKYRLHPFKMLSRCSYGVKDSSGVNTWYWDALDTSELISPNYMEVGREYTVRDYTPNIATNTADLSNKFYVMEYDTDEFIPLGHIPCGDEPQIPTFEVVETGSSHLTVSFKNDSLGINYTGDNAIELINPYDPSSTTFKVKDRRIIFSKPTGSSEMYMAIKGHGRLTILYEIGVL